MKPPIEWRGKVTEYELWFDQIASRRTKNERLLNLAIWKSDSLEKLARFLRRRRLVLIHGPILKERPDGREAAIYARAVSRRILAKMKEA